MHVLLKQERQCSWLANNKRKPPLYDKLLTVWQMKGGDLLDVVTHGYDTRISPFLNHCMLNTNWKTLLDQLTSISFQRTLYQMGLADNPEQKSKTACTNRLGGLQL